MAPPSEVSWDSLSNTIREQHPDIIAAHENATSEVRGLLSELNRLAASSGLVLCSVAIQIGFTCGVWPHDPVSVQGPPSPLALLRTFGSTEEPRVKLYRDHAAWCVPLAGCGTCGYLQTSLLFCSSF